MNRPVVLLTFDVEEFDIPEEYGQSLSDEEKMRVGTEGFRRVLKVLEEFDACATLYTTAYFAEQECELVKNATQRHELASHGLYHSHFETTHLRRSREVLEEVSGQKVRGYRSARFAPVSRQAVTDAGYAYNSSENPIWLPGRYNGWKRPRGIYHEAGIPQVPLSASPLVRFPLFWLAFKNLPWPVFRFFAEWTLRSDGYLHLLFHPWEFCDLRRYGLPAIVKKNDGERLLRRLRVLLEWAQRRGRFLTTWTFLNERSLIRTSDK